MKNRKKYFSYFYRNQRVSSKDAIFELVTNKYSNDFNSMTYKDVVDVSYRQKYMLLSQVSIFRDDFFAFNCRYAGFSIISKTPYISHCNIMDLGIFIFMSTKTKLTISETII